MRSIFILLGFSLFSSYCSSKISADVCPRLRIPVKGYSSFDINVSISSCSSMCEGVVCILGVANIENFTLSLVDCTTINIRGDVSLGEADVVFDYNFTCDIMGPRPLVYDTASVQLLGVEMEIVLMKEGREQYNSLVEVGSTVELSCFSHLNDSSDLSVTFAVNRQSSDSTLEIYCSNNISDCVSPFTDRDWKICRNKSAPYNCMLIIPDFSDSNSGNYSCSMSVEGGDILESNNLDLRALGKLSPAKTTPKTKGGGDSSSKWLVGLGSSVGALLVVMLVIVLIINAVRTRRRSSQESYQRLRNEDSHNEDGVYTPGTNSPNTTTDGACVNVSTVNATSGTTPAGDDDVTTAPPHPVVTLEQSS